MFQSTKSTKVIIKGSTLVHTMQGIYRLTVKKRQTDRLGALHLAYEQLKTKLQHRGLFDPEYKKPISAMTKKVVVITIATGVAVHDIVTIIGRRRSAAKIYISRNILGDNAEQQVELMSEDGEREYCLKPFTGS